MHSWIFKNRARLAVIYGLKTKDGADSAVVRPGNVLKTNDDVLLGPWGRRTA
jgi:hypothetical protein